MFNLIRMFILILLFVLVSSPVLSQSEFTWSYKNINAMYFGQKKVVTEKIKKELFAKNKKNNVGQKLQGTLTNAMAKRAITKWIGTYGKVTKITGIYEIPKENIAKAEITLQDFSYMRLLNPMIAWGDKYKKLRTYSGYGEATFRHYNDGSWRLIKILVPDSEVLPSASSSWTIQNNKPYQMSKRGIHAMSSGEVKSSLHNLFLGCKAFFADNPKQECSLKEATKLRYGFVHPPDIFIEIRNGTERKLKVFAIDKRGGKAYSIDANGTISEIRNKHATIYEKIDHATKADIMDKHATIYDKIDHATRSDIMGSLHNLFLACKAFFADNPKQECSLKEATKLEYGFVHPPDIFIEIRNGTERKLKVFAKEKRGGEAYSINANGQISEIPDESQ